MNNNKMKRKRRREEKRRGRQTDSRTHCDTHQNDKHQEQKSIKMVIFIMPKRSKNKEHFNKNAPKGQHSPHNNVHPHATVPIGTNRQQQYKILDTSLQKNTKPPHDNQKQKQTKEQKEWDEDFCSHDKENQTLHSNSSQGGSQIRLGGEK